MKVKLPYIVSIIFLFLNPMLMALDDGVVSAMPVDLKSRNTVRQDIITTGVGEGRAVVRPEEYQRALRNPIKGFTNRGFGEDNEWATLVHCYIPWTQIENDEADGIDKIRQWCDTKWKGAARRNQKVVPRVYLHWSGDRKYWPTDMDADDYSSEQFVERTVRLVRRLGKCWDGDGRVAYIEMGIIGKWGEHHSPAPNLEIQKILGNAFTEAFPNKKVMVRHPWKEFAGYQFGGYWDSWAHGSQMKTHGAGMARLTDRWRTEIIGGETAYDWGRYKEQPGDNPTDTVSDPVHRNFLIDTIRSLHCTQLRWVADYDQGDPVACAGAEEVQKAFGYRYVLEEVRYPKQIEPGQRFDVSFDVRNTGSAPFYYDWPVELSLLVSHTGEVVWRENFQSTDIRKWLAGDDWDTSGKVKAYAKPARLNTVDGSFTLDTKIEPGEYHLAIAVLDPAGNLPSLRFAIKNYIKSGRHPIGKIGVGMHPKSVLLDSEIFDDPREVKSLRYHP